MTKKLLTATLLAGMLLTAGCDLGRFVGYLLAVNPPTKTVQAEYDDLPGTSVAIVVYADMGIQYEYGDVQRELSLVIAQELRERIEKIRVIDPNRVVRYQHANIYWDSMDKTKLARVLGADHLLYVTLAEFSTREPGSMNLYRGRIDAEAAIYKTSLPEGDARVWKDHSIRVLFPPDAPTGTLGEDDRKIRYATEKLFAQELVKNFYDRKVPKMSEDETP